MSTWTVHAKRWELGWELHIDDTGVTQARTLAVAERQARDYLTLLLDRDVSGDEVVIVPELGSRLTEEVREARRAVAELAERQRTVAALSRSVARELHDIGLAGSE
ncbi:MAG: hypothetical protein EPN43_03700, partial [Jatrophihabitans sp.]